MNISHICHCFDSRNVHKLNSTIEKNALKVLSLDRTVNVSTFSYLPISEQQNLHKDSYDDKWKTWKQKTDKT